MPLRRVGFRGPPRVNFWRSGSARDDRMLLVASADKAISERLAEELVEVERLFAAELRSELACVNVLVRHIERYRGKMLRPMLMLVAGMATSPDRQELTHSHRTLAAVVEMVHMATLVHDDVLDEAQVRRGGETINHLRGNETAVMLGDFLISHAYHLCSGLELPVVSRIIAAATNHVCEGELHQLANRENWDLDEPTYFQIIRGKTACLCGTCCRLAAMLNQAPEYVAEALYNYGENLGLAFQIVDDLLDLTGDQETVGKTLGLDLQKGKLTLPLIHLLSRGAAGQQAQLREILAVSRSRPLNTVETGRIRELITAAESVHYANQTARRLVDDAKASLHVLPESSARRLLHEMADAVLTRKF